LTMTVSEEISFVGRTGPNVSQVSKLSSVTLESYYNSDVWNWR